MAAVSEPAEYRLLLPNPTLDGVLSPYDGCGDNTYDGIVDELRQERESNRLIHSVIEEML